MWARLRPNSGSQALSCPPPGEGWALESQKLRWGWGAGVWSGPDPDG